MSKLLQKAADMVSGDANADRVVPPTGYTATLTLFTSASMAFLVVFALALSMATGRLADRWGEELAQNATVRISAPQSQMTAQVGATLRILEGTEGVASARALNADEQRALLEPWFGPDLPVDSLPIPQMIAVTETRQGIDAEGLRLRLAAEVPGAVLDDHTRWREPLVNAASALRVLGVFSILLIGLATAAMITLAANAALSANTQVVSVLRLVGAKDSFIANAFVRRFTLRALFGATIGTFVGGIAILLLPQQQENGLLTGLSLQGWQWLLLLLVPPLAAGVAFAATQAAARKTLRDLS